MLKSESANMDYSIRIPATDKRIEILEKKAKSKKLLSKIKDYVFKPKGVGLKDFHPDKTCIRLREFIEDDIPSTLVKITTTKTKAGYTDQKERLGKGKTENLLEKADKLGFQKWGEIVTVSTEYDLDHAQVLNQELSPIGKFLKIESKKQEGLNNTLELLQSSENEKITKNAAVLLGEKLELI